MIPSLIYNDSMPASSKNQQLLSSTHIEGISKEDKDTFK